MVKALLIAVVALAVLPMLAFVLGYRDGKAAHMYECPKYEGEKLARLNINADGSVTCLYVRHFRGLATVTRSGK